MHQCSSIGQFATPPAVAWMAAQLHGWHGTWYVTGSCAVLGALVTGLIARSAPSLNLFALGLPAGVLAGVAALIIAMPVMVEQFEGVIEAALDQSAALIAPEPR